MEVEEESEGRKGGQLDRCLCEAASQLLKKDHGCPGFENGQGQWHPDLQQPQGTWESLYVPLVYSLALTALWRPFVPGPPLRPRTRPGLIIVFLGTVNLQMFCSSHLKITEFIGSIHPFLSASPLLSLNLSCPTLWGICDAYR